MRRAFVLTTAILLSATASPVFAQDGTVAKAEVFPRLRLGGSAGLGYGTMGMTGAASARAGIQIKSSWAVSYQFSAVKTEDALWGTKSDVWNSHALLVEFTVPETLITLGGGPSIVSGHIFKSSCGVSGCSTAPPSNYTGVGLDLRAALTLGARRPNLRGGFTVELAVHSAIHDTVAVLGIGADLF
jgi:hypothetical protein